jgi:UDP-N-acetylmuramoyl-tripeptide--D-alanyl-D-alanine ligase
MRSWDAQKVAAAAGANLIGLPAAGSGGPARVSIDSRDVRPGDLFVGLPGSNVDGGAFARAALAAGAWGVLIGPEHAGLPADGAVLVSEQPLLSMQRLATAWRRELGASVIAVTGSTGKTTTKDLLARLISPQRRTVASVANFNTEIGLPLQILGAPAGSEVLVLEMGMRGAGQIAELARIAEPDVGVIVSIGPVHLDQLGSLEAVAGAKAELITALQPGATAVLPAGERLLAPYIRDDVRTVTFGCDGDVRLVSERPSRLEIAIHAERIQLAVNFAEPHLQRNLLAAIAAADAIGVRPGERLVFEPSPGRGQRHVTAAGVTLINDAYNANPVSMQAALDLLGASAATGRRVAVLGDMLELGADSERYHREIGAYANGRADVMLGVGPRAVAMAQAFAAEALLAPDAEAATELLAEIVRPGDVVLVKGSNAVGLERVCERLIAGSAC